MRPYDDFLAAFPDYASTLTLDELRGQYARLDHEIDALVAGGERHPGRLGRLLADLDEVHRQIASARRRHLAVPTLSDVIDLDRVSPLHAAAR